VTLFGSTAYASQQPWLLPETIRENVLFGLEYEDSWYQTVIDACALQRDLESFPAGDQTLVGENGANLSGGQKARVNLARFVQQCTVFVIGLLVVAFMFCGFRACYSKADIYLLDDPTSAVDANVASYIMQRCIQGILKEKCVVLVTHHTHFLQNATRVITLDPTVLNKVSEPTSSQEMTIDELFELETTKKDVRMIPTPGVVIGNYGTFPTAVQELRSVGRIRPALIMEYLRAGNSRWGLLISVLMCLAYQTFLTGSDLWLKFW